MGIKSSSQAVRVDGDVINRTRKIVGKTRLDLGTLVSIALDDIISQIENDEYDLSGAVEKYFLKKPPNDGRVHPAKRKH